MPKSGVTVYDLLVSCPDDACGYLSIIKKCVEDFNVTFIKNNNSLINVKHWSTDSYPQSGDNPQELINKQLVQNCDAAIAIFWTRFGTPTDKYGSGTEEEIEEMFSLKKQVFIYFLDEPISPTAIDEEQYNKVLQFKSRYKDRGLYAVVKNKDDFTRQFTKHLSQHFMQLVSNQPIETNKRPQLLVRDALTNNSDFIEIHKPQLLNNAFMNNKRETIKAKIIKLNNSIPSEAVQSMLSVVAQPNFFSIPHLQLGSITDAEIPKDYMQLVEKFAKDYGLIIKKDFWNIGSLKKKSVSYIVSYEGTEAEKSRYTALINLCHNVLEFYDYADYFSCIDPLYLCRLSIANIGDTYDEDISVKIKIKKGILVGENDILYPDQNIIEELLNSGTIESIFKIQTNDELDAYDSGPSLPKFYLPLETPLSNTFSSEKYDRNLKKYRSILENIFCYKYYNRDEYEILKFTINYLKHNTAMAFPSVLLFKRQPETIQYEISSKHTPQSISGCLQTKQI